MSDERTSKLRSQLPVVGLFAVLGLLALYFFVRVVEPTERPHREPFHAARPEGPLIESLTGERLEQRLADIQRASSAGGERSEGRLSGSPGFYATEALVLDAFRQSGLEVQTQEVTVVVPATRYCEVLGADGKPLPGVTLYPVASAGLTLPVVPEPGIEGELVLTEAAALQYMKGHKPEDSIVLTYLDQASAWGAMAAVGVKAVVVMEDESSRSLRVNADARGGWDYVVASAESAYPRFLARGPLAQHAGERLRIRCKVVWEERKVRNLVGVLKGRKGKEALVLTAYYDSNSLIPELAPGAEQAVPLAVLLDLLEGLSKYRGELDRDVVFIATGGHGQAMTGVSRLMEGAGELARNSGGFAGSERRADEAQKLKSAERALALLKDEALWSRGAAAGFRSRWEREDAAFRKWFEKGVVTVAGEINLEHKDQTLAARLAYLRAGSPVFRDGFEPLQATDVERRLESNSHPLLVRLLRAQELNSRSGNMLSLPLWQLVQRPEFEEWGYRERLVRYMADVEEHHRTQIGEIDDTERIRELFARYERTLAINLELTSGGAQGYNDLAVLTGIPNVGSKVMPQVADLTQTLEDKVPKKGDKDAFDIVSWGANDAAGSKERPYSQTTGGVTLDSEIWTICGRMAFTVLNYQFMPQKLCTPEDTFEDLKTGVLKEQVPVLGRALLDVAQGRVDFKNIPPSRKSMAVTLHGTVYGNAGSGSVVPSHPMGRNTFVRPCRYSGGGMALANRGIDHVPVMKTDPYGEYCRILDFSSETHSTWGGTVGVDAARFGDDGEITYFKDMSKAAAAMFRCDDIPSTEVQAGVGSRPKPISISLFRCSRVEVREQGNPKTMKSFRRLDFMRKQGLAGPGSMRFDTRLDPYVAFHEPDFLFYVGLMDGAAENPEVQVYRAFMLDADPSEPVKPDEPEIYGAGYLAADTPAIIYAHMDASESMLRTNEKRLQLQRRYGMSDELMEDFHRRAREWLDKAVKSRAENDPLGAVLSSGKSLAYCINNHPVIRKRIAHAVVGILWYLGLLVPFVFFFEKLVFGFTDIRKQLLASGVIFLVVFSLLRVFHPAFQMVRSSVMILLGFVICLLTLLVTLMVGGKFKQNIKDLRSHEGRIEGADINRGGVIGTAFMLGLNNMRRRKVRTGLTSVTLILITFVMICFTSVTTDLVNVEYPTGRSAWNGIQLQNQNFLTLTPPEVGNIAQIYGRQFPVTTRSWWTASMQSDRLQNAEIVIDREYEIGGQKVLKRAKVHASVEMGWNEPMFSGIDRFMKSERRWFPRPPGTRAERIEAAQSGYKQTPYVILPDTVARELDISVGDLSSTNTKVTVRSTVYQVLGIIDSVALTEYQGMDGRSILPYDLNAVQTLGRNAQGQAILPDDVKRLSGSQVIIVNQHPTGKAGENEVVANCCVLFPKEPYRLEQNGPETPPPGFREQRQIVLEYLERVGEGAYYAIDGIAYYGSRMRARTFEGLLELLIPILIAALTVFNTMRGSVYERKDEIYVYNAVGIAPNHVFFMFMAEACVYAVVGAMLGYLLSQATGRALTALGLTGGMNMNYSSIETIYASLTIVAAVMLSTIMPARSAARLAAPSEVREWTVPVAQGDEMSFNLPFTFTPHDRAAVVCYFHRWLDANGEGSSGPFFCAPPHALLRKDPAETRSGGLVPGVAATIWLKPYDLGVSQRMEIWLPTDPETKEFIANVRLVRMSGTSVAWQRTVKPFLGILRKQFLNWRAATAVERGEMYAEARRLLEKATAEDGAHG